MLHLRAPRHIASPPASQVCQAHTPGCSHGPRFETRFCLSTNPALLANLLQHCALGPSLYCRRVHTPGATSYNCARPHDARLELSGIIFFVPTSLYRPTTLDRPQDTPEEGIYWTTDHPYRLGWFIRSILITAAKTLTAPDNNSTTKHDDDTSILHSQHPVRRDNLLASIRYHTSNTSQTTR